MLGPFPLDLAPRPNILQIEMASPENNPSVPPWTFATTHWSVVFSAATAESSGQSAALERFCRSYWYPLYAHVRRRGYNPEDAQDLTQGFFARMLEKNSLAHADRSRGRFRTFLLASLDCFLNDHWDRSRCQKRGGGQKIISLDGAAAEERYRQEPLDTQDPATLFQRRWVAALMTSVLAQLESEYCETGRETTFRILKDYLTGDERESTYAELGVRLELSENAVKQAVHRLRRRYRQLFREEVARTVAEPGDVEDEMQQILAVLSD